MARTKTKQLLLVLMAAFVLLTAGVTLTFASWGDAASVYAAANIPTGAETADNTTDNADVPVADYVYNISYDSDEGEFVAAVAGSSPSVPLSAETMTALIAEIDSHAETDWEDEDNEPVKKLVFGSGEEIDLGTGTALFNGGTYIIDGKITSANAVMNIDAGADIASGTIRLINGASVTMVGGTVENTSTSFAVGVRASEFTLIDGTIQNTAGVALSPAVLSSSTSSLLTIRGGHITAGNMSASEDNGNSGTICSQGARIEMTGGTVTSTGASWAIFFSGNESAISGGTVEGKGDGGALIIRYTARVTLSGDALLTACTGRTVLVRAFFTMNGGTVENTGNGTAIRVSHANYDDDTLVTINGGVVKTNDAAAVHSQDAGSGDIYIIIAGGTFQSRNGDVLSFVNEGNITITGGSFERLIGNRIINKSGANVVTIGDSKVLPGNFNINVSNNHIYDGNPKEGLVSVDGFTAAEYTIGYLNNINAGSASIVLTSTVPGCDATFKVHFPIQKATLTGLVIDSADVHTYGSAYTLNVDGIVSQSVVSYTIDTVNSTGAGTIDGNVLTVTKAGEIVIIPAITNADNYEDITGSEFTLTVDKAEGSGGVTMAGWAYGGTASNPDLSGITHDGAAVVSYSTSLTGTFTQTQPTTAGSYWIRVSYVATANYEDYTTTISFDIAKAAGSGNATMAGWTYGGTASTLELTDNTNADAAITYEYKLRGADDSTYTTTVPTAEGDYTVRVSVAATANYEAYHATADFTIAEKDGLSGGAIAGIVVGSVLVAGLGGFAIFWFVVKKKTFPQLGAAIKQLWKKFTGLFKKKQSE